MLPSGFPFTLPGTTGYMGLSVSPTANTPFLLGGPNVVNSNLHLSPVQLIQQAILHEQLKGVNMGTILPLISALGTSSPISLGNFGLSSATAQQGSLATAPLSVSDHPPGLIGFDGTTQKDVDVHTIVRAPVLYNIPVASSENRPLGSKDTEQSPPDRIVASYAAAAHAAALVNHQPVSKAAENFLSTSSTRSRHSKRSMKYNSQRLPVSEPCKAITGVSPNVPSISPVCSLTDQHTPCKRTGWSRIVDRTAMLVEYISPDGMRLHDREEALTYLRSKNLGTDDTTRENLVSSCFNFDPTSICSDLSGTFDSLLVSLPPCSVAPPRPSSSSSLCSESSKINPAVCRISFNPNHVLNSNSISPKRLRLSTNTPSHSDGSSTKTDSAVTPFSSEVKIDATALKDAESVPLPQLVAYDDTIPSSPSTNCNGVSMSTTVLSNNPGADYVSVASPVASQSANCSVNDSIVVNDSINSSGCDPSLTSTSSLFSANQLVNCDTAVKMTTETVTTGSLNLSLPSSGPAVVPSVIPPPSYASTVIDGLGLLATVGLPADASSISPNGPNSLANNLLALEQIVTNSRLAEQQQQLVNYFTALTPKPNSSPQVPAWLLGSPLLSPASLQPLLLATNQPGSLPMATGWSDFTANHLNSLTLQQQQQQLASAVQQQLVLASLLQRPTNTLPTTQQHMLSAAAQVQSYLAAIQRQLPHGSQ